MPDIIAQLMPAIVSGVVVGVAMSYYNRKQEKQESIRKAEAEATYKGELLRIDLMVATAKLSYAVAMAMKRGYPNGEVEEGIKFYEKAMTAFREFEREQIAKM